MVLELAKKQKQEKGYCLKEEKKEEKNLLFNYVIVFLYNLLCLVKIID